MFTGTDSPSLLAGETECFTHYRSLADAMPLIVWISRDGVGVDYYSRRWFEYTGLKFAGPGDLGWQAALHPEDGPVLAQVNASAWAGGEAFEFEYRLRRHDGIYRWHFARVVPLRDSSGRVYLWIGTGTDIDDQKRQARQQFMFLHDVLAGVTEGKLRLCASAGDLPVPLPPAGEAFGLAPSVGLSALRHGAQAAAQARSFPEERWMDMVTAVGEAAMNAVAHGGGLGQGRIHADADTVQVWVSDQGDGIAVECLAQATLKRGHSTAGSFGHGFWLMLNTLDRVWLLTGPAGTTLVLEQGRDPVAPVWPAGP